MGSQSKTRSVETLFPVGLALEKWLRPKLSQPAFSFKFTKVGQVKPASQKF
jgi:hypothetical protein